MIIGKGRLVTNDPDHPYFEDGALRIVGQLIDAVGNFDDLKKLYPDDEVLDAQGRVIMPGMINAHTHIYSSYARGMGVSKPTRNFPEILKNLWWALDRSLTMEDNELSAYTTYIDSIRNGVTTLFDHHASPHAVEGSLFTLAEAAKEIGIRSSFSMELSDRDGVKIADQEIKENVDFIRAMNTDEQDMVKGMFGMHASFTISDKTMEKVKKAMEGIEAGYHIHVGEGREDQYDSLKKYDMRVTERLLGWGLLGPKSIAVHAVNVNGRELDILAETDTTVVHNPMSNMGNAVGATPVLGMLRRGIRLGLGTDAYTHDMFESVKVSKILQSHRLSDPTVGFSQALQLQYEGNPAIAALHFKRPLGVLKEGAYADIITLDYFPFTPFGGDNWKGHLLFGGYGRMTNDVVINGKLVMRNREILTVDEEKIFARTKKRAAAIWPKL
ncbi:MAG: putative aminohydrolase SsnA [Clostridiaceae bacterium]|nr:putative aminohydrolase SsnA [Clostridiaceae bacterium]